MRREYERLAARYDRRWAFYIGATVRETLRRMPAGPGARLLDVGCGTGAFLAAVRAAHADARLAGVDLSPAMLTAARRRLPSDVALEVASAEALPFPRAGFDTVVSISAFHFFRAPRAALGEMRRVLRPGGTLVLTDWCGDYLACRLLDRLLRLRDPAHFRTYGSAGFGALIEDAGFAAVRVERYRISWFWGLMTAVARNPD
ncbi:MAG TPA: methyltransferase domain-containing protein [Thermohalobaculum sp.]|nr:methyltransferase domain-containing protein [Thermohalobaculum sp.]